MGVLDSGPRRCILRPAAAADDLVAAAMTTTVSEVAADVKNSLPKSFSSCNLVRATRLRDAVADDLRGGREPCFGGMHTRSVALFGMGTYSESLRRQLERHLLEMEMQVELERRRLLNWCPQTRRLYALKTPGDGNCLVHAASLAMWAVSDSECTLRSAMHSSLCDPGLAANFRRRWMRSRASADGAEELGFRYSTRDWEEEWSKVVEMSRPTEHSSRDGFRFQSLEEIHIFILANVLRRPIVIISDVVLRSLASGSTLAPLNISGIYLPLNWLASACYRYPLVLGFHNGHFAPLVCMQDGPAAEQRKQHAFPLVDRHRATLPLQFLLPEEEQNKTLLLQEYMDTQEVAMPGQRASPPILMARLPPVNTGDDLDLVSDYREVVERKFRAGTVRAPTSALRAPAARHADDAANTMYSATNEACSTPGCGYMRSVHTGAFCHECISKLRAGSAGVVGGTGGIGDVAGRRALATTPHLEAPEETEAREADRRGAAAAPPSPTGVLPSAPEVPALLAEPSGMKCSSRTCPFTGDQLLAGLCQNCFHLRQGRRSASENVGGSGAGAAEPPTAANAGGHAPERRREEDAHDRCSGCGEGAALGSIALCQACVDKPSLAPTIRREEGGRGAAEPARGSAGGAAAAAVVAATMEAPRSEKCKTPGCDFFGTATKEFYCTICFLQYLENRAADETQPGGQYAEPPRGPPAAGPARQEGGRIQCVTLACRQLGKARLDGCCTDCYLNRASEREEWEPALELRAAPAAAPKCRTESCADDATAGGALCAACRRRNEQLRHTHPQRLQRRQTSGAADRPAEREPVVARRNKCRAPGCEHYGNGGCNGYCNECHAMIQLYGR
ncbi:LOW QUALITY PROTEIN: tumor necrosis factor alpha-induced protein 3-like [Lampetra planeri]